MHNELLKMYVKWVSQGQDHWKLVVVFILRLLIANITVLNAFNWIFNQVTLIKVMRKNNHYD
jgi:hypothetical protein